jgi:hypothetical protein
MSCSTPCTVQVIDASTLVAPFDDMIIDVTPGRLEEPGSTEPFDIPLVIGQTEYAYIFQIAKPSDLWDITGHVENLTDGTVQAISWVVTARSRFGFTVELAAVPESGNTHFRGTVRATAAGGSVGSGGTSDSNLSVRELPEVNALTGTSTALNVINPTSIALTVGRTVFITISGQGQFWRLDTGTVQTGDVAVAGNPSLRWRQVL